MLGPRLCACTLNRAIQVSVGSQLRGIAQVYCSMDAKETWTPDAKKTSSSGIKSLSVTRGGQENQFRPGGQAGRPRQEEQNHGRGRGRGQRGGPIGRGGGGKGQGQAQGQQGGREYNQGRFRSGGGPRFGGTGGPKGQGGDGKGGSKKWMKGAKEGRKGRNRDRMGRVDFVATIYQKPFKLCCMITSSLRPTP